MRGKRVVLSVPCMVTAALLAAPKLSNGNINGGCRAGMRGPARKPCFLHSICEWHREEAKTRMLRRHPQSEGNKTSVLVCSHQREHWPFYEPPCQYHFGPCKCPPPATLTPKSLTALVRHYLSSNSNSKTSENEKSTKNTILHDKC